MCDGDDGITDLCGDIKLYYMPTTNIAAVSNWRGEAATDVLFFSDPLVSHHSNSFTESLLQNKKRR